MHGPKHPVEDHFGFIKSKAIKLVGNYGRKNCDIDDVTQELAAEVLRRWHKFDATKAPEIAFISKIVDSRIKNLIRHRRQKKRDSTREEYSIDRPPVVTVPRKDHRRQFETDFTDPKAERDWKSFELGLAQSEALEQLPDVVKEAAELLKALSISEAAREMGVPRTTFRENYMARIRQTFEDSELNEFL